MRATASCSRASSSGLIGRTCTCVPSQSSTHTRTISPARSYAILALTET